MIVTPSAARLFQPGFWSVARNLSAKIDTARSGGIIPMAVPRR